MTDVLAVPVVGDVKSPQKKKNVDGRKRAGTGDVDANLILMSKRERKMMITPQHVFDDWTEKHLREKQGITCNMAHLYSYYLSDCTKTNSSTFGEHQFYLEMKKKYPIGFGIADESELKGHLKEVKKAEKKAKSEDSGPRPKHTVMETFRALGNPPEGLSFRALSDGIKKYYPLIKLAKHPNLLLHIINTGVKGGSIGNLRGVGKLGYYRAFFDEEEQKELDQLREMQQQQGQKAKATVDGEEKKVDGEVVDSNATDAKPATKVEKKKKPATRVTTYKKRLLSEINHRHPKMIEDTLPLAMTYMSEPKQATYHQIKRYISDIWPNTINKDIDKRLEEALTSGIDNGWWLQLPDSDTNLKQSSFKLTLQEFDPSRDDKVTDRVTVAIVAMNEPKKCTALKLKEYWRESHPEFRVDTDTDRYRKGIERGIGKGIVKQVSGIGISGSFELVEKFRPDPYTLVGPGAGESDDEEGEDDDDDDDDSDDNNVDYNDEKGEKYTPRPTKSGRYASVGGGGGRRGDTAARQGGKKKGSVDETYHPGGKTSRKPRSRKPSGKGGRKKK